LIEALPATEEASAARTQPTPKPQVRKEAPKPQPAAKPQPKKPATPAEPSRIWVQIASGANKDSLPREFVRLKAKAPTLFKGRTGWTTSARATNRLLVGPFKTDREARDFVNQLSKAQLAGFAWTSSAGQAIEKLPAR
jgi:cell division septation protein DedD